MYISLNEQMIFTLYALFIGVMIGLIYDIFRIIRISLNLYYSSVKKIKKIFSIILDLSFSILYTVIIIVFIFHCNNGKFRFYLLFFALVGFFIYYNTMGRLVMLVSERVISLIKKLFKILISPFVILFKYIYKSLCKAVTKAFTCLCTKIKKWKRKRYTTALLKEYIRRSNRGFTE